ncbi:MAG TPA: type I phosphomannose isomerase catalytic subunit [Candidatus Acidoferrales bacterium]
MSREFPLRPSRLEPIFVPRIWGAKTLAPLFSEKSIPARSLPEKNKFSEPIGEVWLTANECKFAEGPFAGYKLNDVWRDMPQDWAGTHFQADEKPRAAFPLLVKFLFPADKLSVQVHPHDDYAQKHEAASGGVGKTEIWYAVAAQPESEVFVGLKPGVTRQVFRRAVDEGTVENCLNRIPVSAGDAIFVPAGTAHTIGPGSVLCEIQQNSDLTYRVHDYNRRQADGTMRPLHINKAMDVLNFDRQRGGKVEATRASAHGAEVSHFVANKYFALEKWQFSKPIDRTTNQIHFDLWIVVAGKGRITWGEKSSAGHGESEYHPGEAWFLPAAQGSWRIEPAARTTMLCAFVPDLARYAVHLSALGIPEDAIAQIVKR